MVAIDKVILSSNNDHTYLDFWPIVARAYTKILQIPVTLAFVDHKPDATLVAELSKHGEVVVFEPVDSIPIQNQAKLARHFLASQHDQTVCYIDDIDLLPLSRDFIVNKVADRKQNHLLAVGADFWAYGNNGVFPISQMTAEGHIFQALYNPDHLDFSDFIRSFADIHSKYPNVRSINKLKEDIINPNPPDESAGPSFSDEYLTRFLRDIRPVQVMHKSRGYDHETQSVDRGFWWEFKQGKLDNHEYLMAHCVRPLRDNLDKIQPLVDYIEKTY